jgi:hypothetical protein
MPRNMTPRRLLRRVRHAEASLSRSSFLRSFPCHAGREASVGASVAARNKARRLSYGRADRQWPRATPNPDRARLECQYPSAIAALANLNVKTAYLEGELCGVDDAVGRASRRRRQRPTAKAMCTGYMPLGAARPRQDINLNLTIVGRGRRHSARAASASTAQLIRALSQ